MSADTTEAWFETASDSAVTVRFTDHNDNKDEESSLTTVPRFAVGYWSIRGLAAPLRMMLCASRTDFVAHMYDSIEDVDGEAGGWTSSYFAEKKQNLLHFTPFMNLPFIVDQEAKLVLTQTNACFQYLGEQLGMMGKNPSEHTLCVQLLCEVYDLRVAMVTFAYDCRPEEAKKAVLAARLHFSKFNDHLQSKKTESSKGCHTVGDSFTAPDFHLFEMIDQFDHLCQTQGFEDCLADCPHVRAFYTAFAQLEYVCRVRLTATCCFASSAIEI